MQSLVLDQRRSTPSRLLGEPAPDDNQLGELLRIASRVPDHGALAPWRFLRLQGEARVQLGEALAVRARVLDPMIDETALDKERNRFVQAPLVIVVIGCYQHPHKIPVVEQQLTAGCVCFCLLQAAQAAGFGAQWLTGWAAYDPEIRARLGLSETEAVVGFIHIGTPKGAAPERPRPDPSMRIADWTA
ncbi:MAG: nitroreductase [Lysobacterales bacterium]|jgi:nitroreductase